MKHPNITVCILNYNYGRYLAQAIESALQQRPGRYRLAEVLIIDDGSTDDSLSVCEPYGDRIRVVARPHHGFASTLSEGIQRSTGQWIALLDADDWFSEAKLVTVSGHLCGDTLLVQHWEHVARADGSPLLSRPHPGGNMSTLVVRRDAALDLLPVANEVFLHVFDDLGRGVKLLDPLVHYRVHESNMTDRRHPGVWQDYLRSVTSELSHRLRELATHPPAWADSRALRRLAWHYSATAHGHAREAAVQRRQRVPALFATSAELAAALLARRALSARILGARSALTMRELVTLADNSLPMPQADA